MKFTYELTHDDYLVHQLYRASYSDIIRKKRLRSRLLIPVFYLATGLFLYFKDGALGGTIAFLAGSFLWYALYPRISKWRYRKHYSTYIAQHYQKRMHKPVEIEFGSEHIHVKDFMADLNIKNSEVSHLVEIQHHFFLQLATDEALVIPKTAISDVAAFKALMSDLNLKIVDELAWYWK